MDCNQSSSSERNPIDEVALPSPATSNGRPVLKSRSSNPPPPPPPPRRTPWLLHRVEKSSKEKDKKNVTSIKAELEQGREKFKYDNNDFSRKRTKYIEQSIQLRNKFTYNEIGTKLMKRSSEIHYLRLYKAALSGDWATAKKIFEEDPPAKYAKVSKLGENVLQVAISKGKGTEFVHRLVESMTKDSLEQADYEGDTPLHYAAFAGNTEAVKILLKKNPKLSDKTNKYGFTPLHSAAFVGQRKTVCYLLSTTDLSSFWGEVGFSLLIFLINADFYDIALDILYKQPSLAVQYHGEETALLALAQKPHAFPSGNLPVHGLHCLLNHLFSGRVRNGPQSGDVERPMNDRSKECPEETKFKRSGCLNFLRNANPKQTHATKLLRYLTNEVVKETSEYKVKLLLPAVRAATQLGIAEFVAEVIKVYPQSIWMLDENKMSLFHLAVKHRQENVFSLLRHHMNCRKPFVTIAIDDFGNNLLHLAGEFQPSNRISGAALQMQRELQWFEEVKYMVRPSYRIMKNCKGETPEMVFDKNHEKLLEKSEKWMKDTATSCSIVAALVVTVVFAAAFTVPGGNDQNHGIPIFLFKTSFIVFALSDAVAIFSSSISLLTFLAIHTSRCSKEDFHQSLPMRLSIGLITLFFSIAFMMAAFCSSLYIVLSHRVRWIAVPIGLLTCIPITFFVILHFSLLVDLFRSTYKSSIFPKQSDVILT